MTTSHKKEISKSNLVELDQASQIHVVSVPSTLVLIFVQKIGWWQDLNEVCKELQHLELGDVILPWDGNIEPAAQYMMETMQRWGSPRLLPISQPTPNNHKQIHSGNQGIKNLMKSQSTRHSEHLGCTTAKI